VRAALSDPAIRTRGLTKVFPPKRRNVVAWARRVPRKPPQEALQGVDLDVQRGELYGLLGPNGAGKTTLVKILSTLLLPTEGDASVAGLDVREDADAIRRKVGVVLGGDRALYWRLTARENLWYFSQLYDTPREVAKRRIGEVLAQVDLLERADDRVENYSKGMKQRLHIARGLLTDPEILLLDEPTIGLDVVSKEAVREFLVALNREQGTTVLLTTHDLTDVERLCERLLIIDHGRVIEDGTVAGITARYGTQRTLVVDLLEPGDALVVEGAEVTKVDGPRQWLRFDRDAVTASELLTRVTAQAEVRDLSVEEPDIESIVREIYGR
jgi:ABC-2 type transport system ATP-binding protein